MGPASGLSPPCLDPCRPAGLISPASPHPLRTPSQPGVSWGEVLMVSGVTVGPHASPPGPFLGQLRLREGRVYAQGACTRGACTHGACTRAPAHTGPAHGGLHTHGLHTRGLHTRGLHTGGLHTRGLHTQALHMGGLHTGPAHGHLHTYRACTRVPGHRVLAHGPGCE